MSCLSDLRVLPVQIRLLLAEQAEIVFVGRLVKLPRAAYRKVKTALSMEMLEKYLENGSPNCLGVLSCRWRRGEGGAKYTNLGKGCPLTFLTL